MTNLQILNNQIRHGLALGQPQRSRRANGLIQTKIAIDPFGTPDLSPLQKSDNLQYNTLGHWDYCLIDQTSDVPSTYYFFFTTLLKV